MKSTGFLVLLVISLIGQGWAAPLEKAGVTYDKKPSGRIYGSDGTITDPQPITGKVYDSDGRVYSSSIKNMPNGDNTLAKPLPRTTTPVRSSNGVEGRAR